MAAVRPGKNIAFDQTKKTPFSIKGEGRRCNLGAGWDPSPDFLRVDISGVPDIVADARHLPFQDESFLEVRVFHLLEHLPRESLISVMNDIWRITQFGGAVDIEIPLTPSDVAWADPTHISFFVSGTWDYFILGGSQEQHRLLYNILPWKLLRRERLGNNEILGVTLEKVQ